MNLLRWSLAVLLVVLGSSDLFAEDSKLNDTQRGEQIYKSLCISCHGPNGVGTKKHNEPLAGDRSVQELTDLITRTMPEDDPKKCVGDDARLVSQYIHEAFYSPIAQARIQPARLELSRLTVRQYQQSLADLMAEFRGSPSLTFSSLGTERGLKGSYYKTRRHNQSDRLLERVDPQIQFDFGQAGPNDQFDAREFSIRWYGTLLAPETAEYEFTIRTQHSTRFWLNNDQEPLIDAYVKSGNEHEHRGSMRLVAGRLYPIRLEFSKANQGVDDTDKSKKRPIAPAGISLEWKLPNRMAEVIPQRFLFTRMVPPGYVVNTHFPPDDRSMGYERGNSVSQDWDQAITNAALEATDFLTKHSDAYGLRHDNPEEHKKKAKAFCHRFAERAFRRPLTDDQKQLFIERHFQEVENVETAWQRSVLLILMSPRFLYRDLNGFNADPYDVASRLSFSLWDSLPDAELLKAAAKNELQTREQLNKQVQRMLNDVRTQSKLREFFQQWLKTDHLPDLAKSRELYPDFSAELAADLRTSLDLFVEQTVWSEASDFRRLLLSAEIPLNGRLAKYYGVDLPAEAPFQAKPLDPEHRAGVLTHPFLLANFAYTETSSPIHRGVFISRSMLGRALKTPPIAVAPLAVDLHPNLTTRERVLLQTKAEACYVCHAMINPLGFSLEHFDAVGKFRTQEKGKPIDAAGKYLTRAGNEVQFKDVRELANFLATSEEAHAAFVEQLFHFMVKQPIRAHATNLSTDLQRRFRERNFNIKQLAADIVVSSALPK
jgi:hypothetical protein